MSVTLDELVAMFAGERTPDDTPGEWEWVTTPAYSVRLALEICRRTDPPSGEALRRTVYRQPVVDIDDDALEALKLAYDHYRQSRQGRGL